MGQDFLGLELMVVMYRTCIRVGTFGWMFRSKQLTFHTNSWELENTESFVNCACVRCQVNKWRVMRMPWQHRPFTSLMIKACQYDEVVALLAYWPTHLVQEAFFRTQCLPVRGHYTTCLTGIARRQRSCVTCLYICIYICCAYCMLYNRCLHICIYKTHDLIYIYVNMCCTTCNTHNKCAKLLLPECEPLT
jgi:hypothetical protein